MRAKKFEHVIAFRVNDELHQRIHQAAALDDRRPGAFMRRLVESALPRAEGSDDR